ncbi:MAG: penicillin-binding protein 2 [Alphaproteobacteria bacterium]
MLAGGQFLLLSSLVGRLYYLQVLQSDRYAMLADENRINIKLLPPPRGRILDRHGEALATNRLNYRVALVSEHAKDITATLDALASLIPLSKRDYQRVLRDARRKRDFVPITVRENLTWSEVSRIEVNAPDLAGVVIEVGQTRYYPLGATAVYITGYVAAVSEDELTGDPLLALPDSRIGKSGVEKIYDLALRGKAGNSQVEVNAYGRVIRELERNEGQPGDALVLTLDAGLQRYVSARIAGQIASAVVLDIHTGDVLALASSPSYDPNLFTKGISTEDWNALLNNPYKPLISKAISGQYPPGSTFKMMVALAALEGGIAGRSHEVTCRGEVELGNRTFHCWKRGGHGKMTMVKALEQSCDVYFYDIALRVGINRIAKMARRFGFGELANIDLYGERPGLMPDRDWKLANYEVAWQKGETLVAGIGQGFVQATPLQLAVMAARIASGGTAVTPHLSRRALRRATEDGAAETGPVFESLGLSPASLDVIVEGMTRVVNNVRGTAYRARIDESELAMAGKTGTSQVRNISKSERKTGVFKNAQRPWEERDHALFVAFAPIDDPRYSISIVVEHGGSGSSVAAPIARDILRETQRRDPARDGSLDRLAAVANNSNGG